MGGRKSLDAYMGIGTSRVIYTHSLTFFFDLFLAFISKKFSIYKMRLEKAKYRAAAKLGLDCWWKKRFVRFTRWIAGYVGLKEGWKVRRFRGVLDAKSKFCGQQNENEHKEAVTQFFLSLNRVFPLLFFYVAVYVCATKELRFILRRWTLKI